MLNKIGPVVSGIIGAPTNWSKVQNGLKKFDGKKCANAVAALMITSICLKDGVGCWMYVHQSLNNEKIPEKRRKFVASLDLTNGGLMILTQILAFFGMKKLNEKLLYSCLGKTFDKTGQAFKLLAGKVRVFQKLDHLKKPTDVKELRGHHSELQKFCLESIGNITNLVAATILAKRIVVPFIATPLANELKTWADKREKMKNGEIPAESKDTIDVSMKGNNKSEETEQPEIEETATNLLDIYKKNMK